MIDLHVHSTASDGTFTPSDVAEFGASFSVMALTDHDNCDGAEEFLASAKRFSNGVRLSGVELSIEPGEGFARFHLLGLGVNPHDPVFASLLAKIREKRDERNTEIIAKFNAIGIDISVDELRRYAKGPVIARPHFANALIARGIVKDKYEAFEKYLVKGAPYDCYVSRWRPEQSVAFDAIHHAGGVTVMAHPKYWIRKGEAFRLPREELERLKSIGLDGLEAVYQANTSEETVESLVAAKSVGLCVTAGSDFHGANKPDISLGMEVDDERRFLEPFFECLSSRSL